MNKLIATGIMFLILSAFVSPALAADTTRAEPKDYKMYTLESNEDTEKLIDFLEENQKVEIYKAESKDDLIKIATTLSEDFGIDGKELIRSTEQPADKAHVDLLETLGTGNIDQHIIIIIVVTPHSITIFIIW